MAGFRWAVFFAVLGLAAGFWAGRHTAPPPPRVPVVVMPPSPPADDAAWPAEPPPSRYALSDAAVRAADGTDMAARQDAWSRVKAEEPLVARFDAVDPDYAAYVDEVFFLRSKILAGLGVGEVAELPEALERYGRLKAWEDKIQPRHVRGSGAAGGLAVSREDVTDAIVGVFSEFWIGNDVFMSNALYDRFVALDPPVTKYTAMCFCAYARTLLNDRRAEAAEEVLTRLWKQREPGGAGREIALMSVPMLSTVQYNRGAYQEAIDYYLYMHQYGRDEDERALGLYQAGEIAAFSGPAYWASALRYFKEVKEKYPGNRYAAIADTEEKRLRRRMLDHMERDTP